MVVLLPAPFGPMKPKISPLPMVKLRSSTAMKSPYRLVKLTTSIMDRFSPPLWLGTGQVGSSSA